MTRPSHRGPAKVVLPALIVGLAISYPGFVSAGARKTAVEGQALKVEFVGIASDFYDSAGGEHFRHLVLTWNDFSLYGEGGIDFHGTATADCSGNVDKHGTGPFSGTFVVRTADQVVWEGRFNGHLVGWMATLVVTAHGKGPFEGTLLMLDMEENDPSNPYADEFDLSGWIVNLGR